MAGAANSTNFIYEAPSGATFEVTADGLSAIRFGGRDLATGHWTAFAAENWFNVGTNAVRATNMNRKTIELVDDQHVRVRHEQQELVCTYDYMFDGDDVMVDARVENNNLTHDLAVIGFSGLTFNFTRPPDGFMPVHHISYIQSIGLDFLHPSFQDPIGGSYAEDDTVGVGLSPWQMGPTRTLFLWDYASWMPDKRDKLPSRKLRFFVADPIPARGARTFSFRMRVSPDRDWHNLLEPYKEYFQETYGALRYHPDDRWIATDYLNGDVKSISRDNPYGFQPDHRRIDTREGVRELCDEIIPVLKKNNAQGIIFWGQSGENPRGAMYRPDFDVLPPEVEAQWPRMEQRFREAGLKLGVQTRPFGLAIRQDWQHDEVVALNVDDESHREMLWRRFDNMIHKGCTLFYLDSFGGSFEDVKLMRWLREKLGPDVLTFSESQCDAILPFTGGYTDIGMDGSATNAVPEYMSADRQQQWEIFQWLVPGAQMASRFYSNRQAPTGAAGPDAFCLQHHITPLLPVDNFPRAPGIAALQQQYLTNRWK